MTPRLLKVRELARNFGGVRAVDGVNFDVEAGTVTGLIGPNGAGKTTALGMIAGAIKPSAGAVVFDDRDITTKTPMAVARLGLIRTFQISSEFARLTLLENLLVAAPDHPGESLAGSLLRGGRAWKTCERELVEQGRELLARFELSSKEDEYAGNLSGGQKRLLEIMRALMAKPKLLLLDEPMAGVNPTLGRKIEGHLRELGETGLTMLMIEHELGVVERLCDRVIVMAQGKVISEGTMESLRKNQEVLDAYLVG
jgi:ABC-type branched-subunit amino acid transport system ATPase component